jgi:hypothetical protein
MNVLRMIKLFGWERQMNERVAEKREEELNWLWKRQMLDLLNGMLKYVHLHLRFPPLMMLSPVFSSQWRR